MAYYRSFGLSHSRIQLVTEEVRLHSRVSFPMYSHWDEYVKGLEYQDSDQCDCYDDYLCGKIEEDVPSYFLESDKINGNPLSMRKSNQDLEVEYPECYEPGFENLNDVLRLQSDLSDVDCELGLTYTPILHYVSIVGISILYCNYKETRTK